MEEIEVNSETEYFDYDMCEVQSEYYDEDEGVIDLTDSVTFHAAMHKAADEWAKSGKLSVVETKKILPPLLPLPPSPPAVTKKPSGPLPKKHLTVYIDTREKYSVSPVEDRLLELNIERKGKAHENPLEVTIGGRKVMKTGDVSVYDEDAKKERGRFEVKRHNDLKGCVSDKLAAFQSQIEALIELGKEGVEFIGLILLYDDKDFSLSEQRTLNTLIAKYQMRELGSSPFVVLQATSELVNLADCIYRLCENIARKECAIRGDHEKLEAHNLREKRCHSESSKHQLELSLRNIPGLGPVAAFAIAKDFDDPIAFTDMLKIEGPAFRKRYPGEKLGRKLGLGLKIAEVVVHRYGLAKKFGIAEESVVMKEKRKPAQTTDSSSSIPKPSHSQGKPYSQEKKPWASKQRYNPYSKNQHASKKMSCTSGFASGSEDEN